MSVLSTARKRIPRFSLGRSGAARRTRLREQPANLSVGDGIGASRALPLSVDPLDALARRLVLEATPARGMLVGITSAMDGEGKSTVAYDLARRVAAAADGRCSVLVLDCKAPPSASHHRANSRKAHLTADVQHQALQNVAVADADTVAVACLEALAQVREQHEIVVADLPSLLADPLAAHLAQALDRLYLVVRAGATSDALLSQAIAALPQGRIDGVILNDARPTLPGWLARVTA